MSDDLNADEEQLNKGSSSTNTSVTSDFLNEQVDTETKMNKKKISCVRCDSLILRQSSCTLKDYEFYINLPQMTKKKEISSETSADSSELDIKRVNDPLKFWHVIDMYTFENVGFTNTVENKKYLICADCEIGPIGFQNLDNPNEFYVCTDRVRYID